VIVAKQRNGPTGEVTLSFLNSTCGTRTTPARWAGTGSNKKPRPFGRGPCHRSIRSLRNLDLKRVRPFVDGRR
jgi:hypothetical protein